MSLSRQQYTLLGIFALFLGPVILVMLMRSSWWQYQPSGLKNYGQLVQPPVQLALADTEVLEHKWVILYRLSTACDQECIEQVTSLRQIHRAAGRNSQQLAVVLLSPNDPEPSQRSRLEAIYPNFIWISDTDGSAMATLDSVNLGMVQKSGLSDNFHTYILDPMLNIILAYGANADPNDIHKDLTRLLKWSGQENN